MRGELAGGRLGGRLAFHSAEDGLQANAKLSLAGADAASLLGSGPRPAIAGKLDVSAEMEGAGSVRSP